MSFQLDTSGYVQCPAPDQRPNETTGCWFWPDLSPFTQGYIEALFDSDDAAMFRAPAFRDLAPETLARIIADCEAFTRDFPGWDHHDGGGLLWAHRQGVETGWPAYMGHGFPPLTVQLGDDGKVRFT